MDTSPTSSTATGRHPFDVIALVASAGGLEAFTRILRDLPAGFASLVIVAQHLAGHGSALGQILRRATSLPIVDIAEGDRLEPGCVFIAPPRKKVELLPDGTFALHPNERGAMEKPLDFLLESLADSVGPRALAVVLTGMGSDAAAGALALRNAGGTVIAQSDDTAEQPSMPRSVVTNGASNLVLPLHEIGSTLAHVVAGGRFPTPRSEVEAVEALFEGPGLAREAMRAVDWGSTSLGPVMEWPTSLKSVVRTVLNSAFPMHIGWGPT